MAVNFMPKSIVFHSVDDGKPAYDSIRQTKAPVQLDDVDLHIDTMGKDITVLRDMLREHPDRGPSMIIATAIGDVKDNEEDIAPGPDHRRIRLSFENARFENEDGQHVLGADEAILFPGSRQMWMKDLKLAEAVAEYKGNQQGADMQRLVSDHAGVAQEANAPVKRGRGGQEFKRRL